MNFRYKINLYRRYPYWSKKKCIYVHIPKAAGTSINQSIYGRTLGHYKAYEIKAKFPKLYQECFVFSVTRNPWDRVVSAYRFAKMGSTGSMAVSNPFSYKIDAFRSFDAFIHEWLVYKELKDLDFIFQPQYLFVTDLSGSVIVDHLGRLDRINDTIKAVQEVLSVNMNMQNINVTSSDSNYKKYYQSNDTVNTVARLYAKDVSLFKYDF
ncbi:sulfotransferase family 2 domain-containing protein [Alloalcanivorax mobilis]|uniref:sulfotransferase family 2 domain-containing protein n=1 Tax=Alloalcanivorax mobilis TaxID=2019569 RepID=UPI000C78EA6F|nr:sulfotransferase family 2 domain-containing protein [Alloalcanivorax mobilis]